MEIGEQKKGRCSQRNIRLDLEPKLKRKVRFAETMECSYTALNEKTTHWLPLLEPERGRFRLVQTDRSLHMEVKPFPEAVTPARFDLPKDEAHGLLDGTILVAENAACDTVLLRPVMDTIRVEVNSAPFAEMNRCVLSLALRLLQ